MQRSALLAVLSAASLLPAQNICLTTIPFTGNTSTSTGSAALFDMTLNSAILVQSIACHYTATTGTLVGLDVYLTPTTYVGNTTNAAAWQLVYSDTGTVPAAGPLAGTVFTMQNPVLIQPGSYGVALVARNASHRYTSGGPNTYSDSIMTLTVGAIQGAPFTGALLTPRVWNGTICYVPAQGYGSWSPYGAGCGAGDPSSFYELFTATSGFDLQNTGFTMTGAGANYVVIPSATPIVQPVAGQIPLTDDQTVQVPLPWTYPAQSGATSSISLCSNGWFSFEQTTAVDLGETVAGLLSGPSRVCGLWDDLNPAAGGSVHAEQDPTNPTLFHITFLNVPEFSVGGSNTFQITLHQGGTIEFKYGSVSLLDCLVGYSRGRGARDPGATDLSALTAIVLGDDRPALQLAASTRPVLGTSFNLVTSAIAPGTVAGATVLSFAQFTPGIDLTAAGAPGCFQHAGTDAVSIVLVAGNQASLPLALPNTPSFAGTVFYGQSAMFSAGINPLGVVTSNGVRLVPDVN